MANSQLYLLDFTRLITQINSHLHTDEGSLELGRFEQRTPKRDPFLYCGGKGERGFVGKFPLIQTTEGTGVLSGLAAIDSERRIGYIFVQRGYIKEGTDEVQYETMRLVFKEPISLRDGRQIPKCSIKLLAETEELAAPYIERRDHLRKNCCFWKRSNLESVLPTDWFLNEAVSQSLAQQPARAIAIGHYG